MTPTQITELAIALATVATAIYTIVSGRRTTNKVSGGTDFTSWAEMVNSFRQENTQLHEELRNLHDEMDLRQRQCDEAMERIRREAADELERVRTDHAGSIHMLDLELQNARNLLLELSGRADASASRADASDARADASDARADASDARADGRDTGKKP